MKPLYIKKNGVANKMYGIVTALFPSYTLAEYQLLEHKPLFWVRTDADYGAIPASMVSYGDGTVADALDSSRVKYIEVTLPSSGNTTTLTLPTGFTTSNCIPLMCQRHYNEEYFISDSTSASVYYSGTVAFLWFKDAYRGADFRLYFMRYV